jgi:hypothetical protein
VTDELFDIEWTATSSRALSKLPEKVSTAVVELCYGPLADNPARLGKPLRFELEGLHCAGEPGQAEIARSQAGPPPRRFGLTP